VVVVATVWNALGGPARDLRVPIQYTEDALEYLMQAQGTIQNGWWWVHPRLGAPGVFEQLTYPSNTNVDQALVWLVHGFASGPGLVVNLTWILMVALSSVVATWCLRLSGLARLTATAAGVLFALLPYALSRNVEHFSLAIFLVPIPCLAALVASSGRIPLSGRARLGLGFGCVLVGFNYIYYAFFGVFVLLVATVAAFVRDRRGPSWRFGARCAALVVVATAVNLTPTFVAWHRDGEPLVIPAKTAAEAETYGLKLRQLVSPVADHPLAIFERWEVLEKRAGFPSETENTNARLGAVASIGFLAMIIVLVIPAARHATGDGDLLTSAAGLTLALVLLATIGGFGSLFSLLVTPAIRAYDRVCPFIAFFALVVVGHLIERVQPRATLWRVAVALFVVAFGTWDQVGALAPVDRAYAATRTDWMTVQGFVGALEPKLPRGAMVFQLPLSTYLNDEGFGRMRTYDEIKPYLSSSSIRWSYPALDNSVVRWQHAVARLPPRAMAAALRAAGFVAIVIDRDGYPDAGESLVRALTPDGGSPPVIAEAPGYVALNLAHVAASPDGVAHLPEWTPGFGPASTNLPACSDALTAHIDSVGPLKAPPAGALALERAASTYEVRGWAIDDSRHALAGDVDLTVDGRPLAAYYGVNRPDVATRAAEPAFRFSGVLGDIPSAMLPAGPHRLTLRVVSADRSCAADAAVLAVIAPGVF
jgi:phosphoglycerol transferase